METMENNLKGNFICEICEKEYSTKQNLKQHFNAIHNQTRKEFNGEPF